MDEWPAVPDGLRERMDDARQMGGRGVHEVFFESRVSEGCPACGGQLTFRKVFYEGEHRDDPDEIAHEYGCFDSSGHGEGVLWILDVRNDEWYFEGTL